MVKIVGTIKRCDVIDINIYNKISKLSALFLINNDQVKNTKIL